MIESPASKEQLGRVREVADALRRGEHADRYAELADQVEKSLNLTDVEIDAVGLGATDTFRFEERLLLRRAIDLSLNGEYENAIETRIRPREELLDRSGRGTPAAVASMQTCGRAGSRGGRSREAGTVAVGVLGRVGGGLC